MMAYNGMLGYGMGNGMMGYGMGLGAMFLSVIFWILIIVGLVLLIKYLWEGGGKSQENALEILKKRYAKGEISKEEFEEMKKDLL